MADFNLAEQAQIGTQQQATKTNGLLGLGIEFPPYTGLAMAPDGQRVTVQVGSKSVNGQPVWYGRAVYLNGLPCNVPLTSLLYGSGELYLGIQQGTVTGAFSALPSVPTAANYAVIQSSVALLYNTDAGANGFPVGIGQTLEISNRPELLAAQIKASSASTGSITVLYYLKY